MKNEFFVDGKGKIVAHDVNGVMLDDKGKIKARLVDSSDRTVDEKGKITGRGDQRLRQIKKS